MLIAFFNVSAKIPGHFLIGAFQGLFSLDLNLFDGFYQHGVKC